MYMYLWNISFSMLHGPIKSWCQVHPKNSLRNTSTVYAHNYVAIQCLLFYSCNIVSVDAVNGLAQVGAIKCQHAVLVITHARWRDPEARVSWVITGRYVTSTQNLACERCHFSLLKITASCSRHLVVGQMLNILAISARKVAYMTKKVVV